MRHERTLFTFVASVWLALLVSASVMAYTWIEDVPPNEITVPQKHLSSESSSDQLDGNSTAPSISNPQLLPFEFARPQLQRA
jgi:hypothetical protein